MSDVMAPLPPDHPLMVAWEKYKASEDYANTRRWMITGVTTGDDNLIVGQFWGAFMAGYNAGSSPNGDGDANHR